MRKFILPVSAIQFFTRKQGGYAIVVLLLLFSNTNLNGQSVTNNSQWGKNGTFSAPVSPVSFNNGNAQSTNSHFAEGQSVPTRIEIEGLTAGTPATLTFNISIIQGSGVKHSFDFFTGPNRIAELIDPISGLTGYGAASYFTFPIPNGALAPGTNGYASGGPFTETAQRMLCQQTSDFGDPTKNAIWIYNGTVTKITYVWGSETGTSTQQTYCTVTFTPNAGATKVLFALGCHIAQELVYNGCPGWGAGQGATSISGSPYHFHNAEVCSPVTTCVTLGSQDQSVAANAICVPPSVVITGNNDVCSGGSTTLTAGVTGSGTYSYQWYTISGGIPTAIAGATSSMLTISPTAATTYRVIVTNTSVGCEAQADYMVNVNANPTPTVSASNTNQTICSGIAIADIVITNPNAVPGTTFSWTRDNTTNLTGIAASGTGSPISGILTNITNTQQTTVFTIIASTAAGCSSTTTATIIVNSKLSINATTATVCSNSSFTVTPGNPAGTTYSWSAPTVTGGITGGAAGSNASNISGILTNLTNTAQTATYTVTPTLGTCTGSTFTVTVTVYPTPMVNTISNATYCNGAAGAAINFGSNIGSATFTWFSSANVGFGFGFNGNIAAYTATNATSSPVVGTINVNATSNGCTGPATTYTITVNPTATITSITNQTVCNNAATTAVNFTSPTTGGTIVYNWTNSAPSIGLAASGSGNIASFTATNGGTAPVTATITVTPSYTNGAACTGTARTFTITVNPILIATINYCGVSSTSSVTFTWAVVSGATGYTVSYQVNASPVVNEGAVGNVLSYNITALSGGDNVTITVTPTGGAGTCFSAATATCTPTACTPPTASISYSGPFCANLATPQSVTLTGTGAYTGGIYTSPAGLTINFSTGTITPSISTPGTYTVTYTIPASGGCAAVAVTTSVTITVLPTATISYAGTPFCRSVATAQAVTLTGTGAYTGGIYSASPAGLTIDAGTGAITPSTSTPGTYTVTYTIPASAGCAAVAVTTSVTITVLPTATISYAGTPFCKSVATAQAVTLTGTGAYTVGAYTASPAGLTINSTTGAITPSTSTVGTYTVTYTIAAAGGCAAFTATTSVTITSAITPTFSQVAAICSGTSLSPLPTTSNNGITGTWSPALNNTATTTYTFTPTAGQCATTATLTITVNPNVTPTFNPVAAICSGATLTALPTTSNNGITGSWSPALNNTATTTYTFTPTAGQCATTATLTITVNPNITPTFNAVAAICSGATLSPLPTSSTNATPITGSWSPALNNTATTTYTFTPTAGQCATTATMTITVNPILSATINCGVSTTTSVTFTWAAVSGATGYNVSYQINAGAVVNVGAIGNVLSYQVTGLTNGDNVTITVTPTGGAGSCFTAATKPCIATGCTPPTITGTLSVCVGLTTQLTGSPTAAAANPWVSSNTSVATVSNTGLVTGVAAGTTTITYTNNNGCQQTAIVAVNPLPTITGTLSICAGLTTQLTGSPTAAAVNPWVSSNTSVATVSNTGLVTGVAAGTTTITYTNNNGCQKTATVTVNPKPAVTNAATASTCSGTSPNIALTASAPSTFAWIIGTITGGITGASASSGATINQVLTNPSNSAAGTVQYLVTPTSSTGSCVGTAFTITVTVNAQPVATAGANITTCTGTSAIAMTGATATGTYSGTPTWSGGAGSGTWTQNANPALAIFTPSTASGSFIATLTLTGTNGCSNATSTRTITWGTQPVATAGSNITTCTGTSAITMTGATATGTYSGTPTWSGGAGSGTWTQNANPALAIFTPSTASGSFTATLTLTGTNGCSNATAIRTITWSTQPTATISYSSPTFCSGQTTAPVTLTGTNAYTGFTFTSSPAGLNINSSTGLLTFTGSTPGNYTISYTIPASGGCSQVVATTPVGFGTPPIITTNTPLDTGVCKNNSITFISAASGAPAPTVQWQLSTDGGATWNNLVGETNPNLTLINTGTNMDGYKYRAIYTNLCGTATTNVTTLAVGAPINLSSGPSAATSCDGSGPVTFTSNANGGNGTVFMSWQNSPDNGFTWIDIPGTTTTSLIGNFSTTYSFIPTYSQNGYLFRTKFRNGGCVPSFSNPALLTVLQVPTVVVSPGNQIVCNGAAITTITFSGTNATNFNWTNNNTSIGLVASGSGNIPSFTAINTGSTDVIASVTVTPLNIGGTPQATCPGNPSTFTITVNPTPVVTTTNACIGAGTVTFTQTNGGAGGTWTVSGGGTINASTGVFTPTTAGCFTATYTTPTANCSDTKNFVVFPAAPILTAPANTCNAAFTLPTVTAVSGFTVQYSINGSAYSSSPTILTTPGCHTIAARYVLSAACGTTAVGTTVTGSCGASSTVSVVIFPTAPVITAPANTCNAAFTLPTVTAVAGFSVQYSIDGGAFSAVPTIPTTTGCHSIIARYVLTAACGGTAANTAGTGSCGSSNTVNVVIFPLAPSAPVVNSGCGAIVVTPPASIAGFNIEYSFDDGVTWGANIPPTVNNCAGYKIKTRYVTSAVCGTIPSGTASTIAACKESPATIRIVDQTVPVITLSAATPVVCNPTQAQINAAFGAATVTDNCSTGLTATGNVGTETGAGCTKSVTKTWTVTDACGNTGTATQTITFTRDTQAPVITVTAFTNPPCNPTAAQITAAFGTATVTDNCSTGLTATFSDGAETGAGCIKTLTRTWTATDACGNASATTRTVSWTVDVTPPVVTGTATITGTQCNVQPAFVNPTATDACGTPTLKTGYPQTGAITPGANCTSSQTRTWIYVDACGNESAPFVQTATWSTDIIVPTVAGQATVTGTQCNVQPAFVTPAPSDNCTGTITLKAGYPITGAVTPGANCTSSQTRTWIYVDACGNESLPFIQTATWTTDIIVPTVTGQTTVTGTQCNVQPAFVTPAPSDNCTGAITLKATYPQTSVITPGANCTSSQTRTWIYVDACGNESAPFVQTATWSTDNAPPAVFAAAPPITVACGAVVTSSLAYTNSASGSCLISGTVTSTLSALPGPCGGTVTETWTFTDACARTITQTRPITVSPAPAPTFTSPPANITVACGAIPAVSALSYTNGASGSCLISGSVTSTQTAAPGPCGGTVTETWIFTDACARTITQTRTITVSPAPITVFASAPPITVACGAAVTSSLAYTNSASGTCLISGTVTSTLSALPGPCGGTVTETWTFTDACNRTITQTRVITVSPAPPAVFAATPPITVACVAIPALSALSYNNGASGTCLISGSVISTQTLPPGPGGGNITETWTFTDTCNRTIITSRVITVLPATTPTFTPVAAICSGATLSALPTTSLNGITGTWSPALNNTTATIYTFTPTAEQCAATATMTITVNPIPSVTNFPLAQTICSGSSTSLVTLTSNVAGTTFSWIATATPGVSGFTASGTNNIPVQIISMTIPGAQNAANECVYSITPTANGCPGSVTNYTVTVHPLPEVTCPANSTICIDAATFALTGGSPAGGTYIGPGVSGGNFNPTTAGAGVKTITYTYTDPTTGCSNSCTFTITVNALPVVTCPGSLSVCLNASPFALTGGSPAGGFYSGTSGVSGGIFNPTAAGAGVHTIIYVYTDPATNCTGFCTFTITVTPLPIVSCPPNSTVCINAASFTLTSGLPAGGSYSGLGVSSGSFNPTTAGTGDKIITYTYTDPANGCTNSCTFTITVNPLPTVTCHANSLVCLTSASFVLTGGSPSGGIYSGTGVSGGIFSPAAAGTGVKSITYTYTDPATNCTNSCTFTITVNPLPTVSCPTDLSVCINATSFALSALGGSPTGGTYSGPGVNGGNFNPATAGAGVHMITYSYTDPATGCSNSCTFTITVLPPSNDNAPGAILLTVGGGCSVSPYTNAGATQSGSEPFAACVGTAGYKTVWYKFTAPASGAVKISNDYIGGTMGSDSRLALFSATDVNNYATFSNIACDDNNGVIVADRSVLYATGLTAGNAYYIQVDGKDGSTATGTFCVTVDELTSSMISTSTACAVGQDIVLVNDNYTGWLSATDASSKLVALIKNPFGGATTSTYTNSLNVNAGPERQDPVSLQYYLDRNYLISNATVSNVNVQIFLLNAELAALQTVDPGVTLANLQVTRQTGATCDNDFVAANGTNSSLPQTSNGTATGYSWVQVTTPGFSKFFLHSPNARMPVKVWLQGAYTTTASLGGPRHRNNTAAWVGALNAGTGGNALNQPYSAAPFNYPGTETVTSFPASTNSGTDILDWVLLELRDATTPATVISRRAAFVRCDGKVVDLDGVSDVSFRNVNTNNYHLVIRHRNHLAIRTSTVANLDASLGVAAPALYDFSLAGKAYVNGAVSTNTPMKEITTGVFGMWGGNANGMTTGTNAVNQVKANAPNPSNDYFYLFNTTLGGNILTVLSNVYHPADMNMDGQVKMLAPNNTNDFFLLFNTVLLGNIGTILNQHQ